MQRTGLQDLKEGGTGYPHHLLVEVRCVNWADVGTKVRKFVSNLIIAARQKDM